MGEAAFLDLPQSTVRSSLAEDIHNGCLIIRDRSSIALTKAWHVSVGVYSIIAANASHVVQRSVGRASPPSPTT